MRKTTFPSPQGLSKTTLSCTICIRKTVFSYDPALHDLHEENRFSVPAGSVEDDPALHNLYQENRFSVPAGSVEDDPELYNLYEEKPLGV